MQYATVAVSDARHDCIRFISTFWLFHLVKTRLGKEMHAARVCSRLASSVDQEIETNCSLESKSTVSKSDVHMQERERASEACFVTRIDTELEMP